MQMKKNKAEGLILSTENEFKSLLQIHNEIKYIIAQVFPFLNQKVIDNLFTILSNQALLYDQILRRGISQNDSLMKQTSMGKLIQTNRNNLEKSIFQHLAVLTTNFLTPLSQSKQDGFTIVNASISNKSETVDDSLRNEQESIITRIKRKMKIEKTNHVRTNSVCLSPVVHKQDDMKQCKANNNINNNKHDRNNDKSTIIKPKPIITSVSNKKERETKRKIILKKKNPKSNTQNQFEPVKNPTQAPIINYQFLQTVSAPNESESRNNKDKNQSNNTNIVLNYRALGGIDVEKDIKSGVSKPSVNAMNLTKKYYDIVSTYEKLNSDDDLPKPQVRNNISLHISEKPLTKRNQTIIKQPKLLITLQNKLFTTDNPSNNPPEENTKKQEEKKKGCK